MGSCEHENQFSVPFKGGEFTDQLIEGLGSGKLVK